MGQQRVALKHHGSVPLVGGQGIDGLIAQIDFALVRALKARDHAQCGGFAAAGGAQQRHKGARFDFQIGILHGVKILAGFWVFVDFGDMLQTNAFLFFRHINRPP